MEAIVGVVRVLLLNQYYAPDEAATAQLLGDVGEALSRSGHEVRVICSSRSYADPTRRYPRRERLRGVDVRRVSTTGFGRSSRLGRSVDYATFLLGAVLEALSGKRPHVVLALSTPPLVAAVGLGVARIRGARLLYWVMDVYPDLAFELGAIRPGSAAARILRALTRRTLRHADRTVALDVAMERRLRGMGAERVVVIPNWADERSVVPRSTSGHRLRSEWGWDGKFVVLYSGNMGLAHEFDTVLAAAGALRSEPGVLFAFVGGGPRRGEVERRAAELGLANVEFRSYVPREVLGESLTAGDVHLVTLRARMSGLLVPSKIYGILAAGRPTIYVGPPEGEIAEILASGDCGTRVANGDAAGLARAVRAYLGDPGRRADEGARARSRFETCYTRSHAEAAFLRVVGELAG